MEIISMTLFRRLLFLILTLGCLITVGCVTTIDGKKDPLSTEEGRKGAIQAYIELAYGYVREGQTEQAKEPLLEALKINSKDADANAAMAYVFQLERDYKPAEEYFRKALSESKNNARILNNYGVFLVQQGRLEDAKQQFLKASEDAFYSERSMVFENLGLIVLQQNHLQEAESYFQRALMLNNSRIRSILSLADIYYRQHNYQEAQRYYSAFIAATDGSQTSASLLLGIRIANALNNKGQAANYASQLQQQYPQSAEYQEYRSGKK